MEIITREEWGAAPAKDPPTANPTYIVIQHTSRPIISRGTKEGAIRLTKYYQSLDILGNHKDDIGYNFIISVGGLVMEGHQGTLQALSRGKSILLEYSEQGGNPYILCEGNYQTNIMLKPQWDALVWVCSYICKQTTLSPREIRGNKDFSHINTPDWLYSQLPRLKQEVSALLNP